MLKIDFISHLYHVVVNGRQIEAAPALTAMGEGTICRPFTFSMITRHVNTKATGPRATPQSG